MSILDHLDNISAGELRKEVEARLQWAYAHGHLSMEELERRLERLQRAEEKGELLSLAEDLPSPEGTREGPSSAAPERNSFFAVLGSGECKGEWTVPAYLEVTALLGSQNLDFRRARFSAEETEIRAAALLGSISFKFPPGVRVFSEGFPLLGSFENRVRSGEADRGPIVRIKGLSLLGGIVAKTKK